MSQDSQYLKSNNFYPYLMDFYKIIHGGARACARPRVASYSALPPVAPLGDEAVHYWRIGRARGSSGGACVHCCRSSRRGGRRGEGSAVFTLTLLQCRSALQPTILLCRGHTAFAAFFAGRRFTTLPAAPVTERAVDGASVIVARAHLRQCRARSAAFFNIIRNNDCAGARARSRVATLAALAPTTPY